jgi:hypothetical protein
MHTSCAFSSEVSAMAVSFVRAATSAKEFDKGE